MRRSRPAATRDLVLIVLAIVVLGIAVTYAVVRSGIEDAAPDDQYVGFRCQACGESFRLSYREFEVLWNERRFEQQADRRTLLYECAKCGQMKAERAELP